MEHELGSALPLIRGDLDVVCPHCGKRGCAIHFTAGCHPGVTLEATYCDGILTLSCPIDGNIAERIAAADRLPVERARSN